MAGKASVIDAVLQQQLGAGGSMRVMAIRASHLAGIQRMGGVAVCLSTLRFVAVKTHFGLCGLRQNWIRLHMNRMTGRASNITGLVLAALPM